MFNLPAHVNYNVWAVYGPDISMRLLVKWFDRPNKGPLLGPSSSRWTLAIYSTETPHVVISGYVWRASRKRVPPGGDSAIDWPRRRSTRGRHHLVSALSISLQQCVRLKTRWRTHGCIARSRKATVFEIFESRRKESWRVHCLLKKERRCTFALLKQNSSDQQLAPPSLRQHVEYI